MRVGLAAAVGEKGLEVGPINTELFWRLFTYIDADIFYHWLQAFLFTLVVEAPVYILVARGQATARRALLAGIVCSCITHPLLVFVWRPLARSFYLSYAAYIVSGEICVAISESYIFFALARPIRFWRAVSASFLANAASYGLGQLCHWLGIF